MSGQITGFVSYSHKDEALFHELMTHLTTLEGLSIFWNDHEITAGAQWNEVIVKNLQTAHVILLLISSDFIASKYIKTVEVQEAMKRHARGEACVIPILLRSVNWEDMAYHELQALPRGGKPVAEWSHRDKAFKEITLGIKEAIQQLGVIQQSLAVVSKTKKQESRFYEALLELDYDEQTETFRRFTEDRAHVGAFLIHGESHHGQAWLLNRLIIDTDIENTEKRFYTFSFARKTIGRELDELLDDISRWLDDSDPLDSPEPIIKKVYQLWLKQSVVLKIGSIDMATSEYVHEFLQKFWEPLVETIQRESKQKMLPDNYLLLFLVDNAGTVESWSNEWQDQFETPIIPVKLKRIREFTHEDLEGWIKGHRSKLPIGFTSQDALAEGDRPETVFNHICKVCGYRWLSQEGARFLAYDKR